MSIGKPIKKGFLLTEARKGVIFTGTIKRYGNKEGVAVKAMKGNLKG